MIIEDDIQIRENLKDLLEKNSYQVVVLEDFKNALEKILLEKANLLLLDINIPYISGEILIQDIRKKSNIPIIMVTSYNNETDEALSISYGADDYITKPYNPNILLLRIKNILRRVNKYYNDKIIYKDLIFDISKGTIKNNNKEIILTKNETIIFSYLLSHKEEIVSRDELMTILWDNTEFINDNTLTVNISRLRKKLEELETTIHIDTRKSRGYILL